jgi:hypothetical protein
LRSEYLVLGEEVLVLGGNLVRLASARFTHELFVDGRA